MVRIEARPNDARPGTAEAMALWFGLVDWAAAAPGLEGRADWMAWAASGASLQSSDAPVPAQSVPPLLRRRLDRMGRLALQCLYAIGAGPQDAIVFASRYGEMHKSFELMRQIEAGELPSPTLFALSVHNALAGQAAIALGNREPHTAIAASADTLAAGIIEARLVAQMRADHASLLVYCDATPPAAIRAAEDDVPLVAIALKISVAPGAGAPFNLRAVSADGAAASAPEALLRLLADPSRSRVNWRGRQMAWELSRAD